MKKIGNFETQYLMLDTLSGPQPRIAPAGWTFDKTATIAWCKMVTIQRDMNNAPPQTTKRDLAVMQGKIETLGSVLALSLGMAEFYWTQAAQEFAEPR